MHPQPDLRVIRSTDPNTPEGKARSSANALSMDSLPESDILDGILRAYVEEYEPAHKIADDLKLPITLVHRIINLVDHSEYKRQQAAPGLKVTSKAFGVGRRFPIAQRFSE